MTPINIEKRYAEHLESIRRRVARSSTMTDAEKRSILNKCDKLEIWSRKAGAQLQRGHYRTAAYDARTQEDMAAQAKCKKAVFLAMLGGRHIDLTNAAEFQVSQMHTTMCRIRKDIAKKYPDLSLCDEWIRLEGQRPYKRYWIVKNEITNE